jgi:thiol-disulfide isomerase/thioredoxin
MLVIDLNREFEKILDRLLKIVGTKKCYIMFYADWCGHCKKIKPIWNNVKKNLKNDKNIVIIEIEHAFFDYIKKANPPNKKMQTKFKMFTDLMEDGITGVPTIMKIDKMKNNELKYNVYDSGADFGNLLDFFKK